MLDNVISSHLLLHSPNVPISTARSPSTASHSPCDAEPSSKRPVRGSGRYYSGDGHLRHARAGTVWSQKSDSTCCHPVRPMLHVMVSDPPRPAHRYLHHVQEIDVQSRCNPSMMPHVTESCGRYPVPPRPHRAPTISTRGRNLHHQIPQYSIGVVASVL